MTIPRPTLVPEGERVILSIRPDPVYVLLNSLGWLVGMGAAAAAAIWAGRNYALPFTTPIVLSLAALVLLKLVWETLQWLSRTYILTERRAVGLAGVIHRYRSDLPLARVQHLTLFRPLLQRLTGVGTIGFATAGTGLVEMYWVMVDRPHEVLVKVRDAVDAAREGPGPRGAVPVIGLAGGIGAGKSEVARALAAMGCTVINSDLEAREVMQRPEIRDELVRWWGSGILEESGQVSRSRIADIVFKDPEQRRRLEALIHPLVRSRRADLRAAAEQRGARAVVVDAPLLFEAGVDRECDAVIFVDAPRTNRLERVRARGWEEAELDRREAAQLPLEEKRRRSTHVIVNDGSLEALRARVRDALVAVERARGRPVAAESGAC